jgi:transposase
MGRVRLSRGERRSLEQIVRLQRVEARRYRRARMVLLAASGKSISAIARQLGTCRLRVGQWLKRFEQVRLSGLEDRPRSGRPIEITALEHHQVIATVCRAPKDLGMARNTWTHESLREVLVRKGLVRRISTSEVGRILGEADLKPHRVKGWCHSSDPDFQAKMRTIVALYVRRPAGAPVLSVDEKTGMQALSRARELQPAAPGRAGRLEFEYRRNGSAACLPVSMWVRGG